MKELSYMKKIIITPLFIALCVVLPMAFHTIPNAGGIFCPMHIPVLLCGLICGWQFGLLCGILGPVLSSVLTSMPPMAILPCMAVELAIYGIVTGIMIRVIRTKRIYADLYISLITALICGKIIAGIVKALLFSPNGYSVAVWATSYFVTALPGIVIQLVLIPAIVVALEKAKLIHSKY